MGAEIHKYETIVAPDELRENCYLFWCAETLAAAVIDPGCPARVVLTRAAALGLRIGVILLTHGHHDHIGAAAAVREATGAAVCVHAADEPLLGARGLKADRLLNDGDVVPVGRTALRVIHTPGHTPGGLCFYAAGILFSGDTLFHTDVGYTHFPGGSADDLARSIREKLYVLDEATVVLPGHEESTTIGEEKYHNLCVRCQD
ncbi:MAG: MBL fold metallo-hydrolase [Gracilibacteraceae bacterium]|jgi:glyoxylase-like metal-dependent hydrolase (beta-lactamase superfamily II)|nr:MBL fold metallo-hydrolase [Gracilibacteraceae bacterium]